MSNTVLTSEKPSNSSPLNPPSRVICHVCQKQFSQYTCPRCNSRYCSLSCYKSHSVHCTESFMRENVVDELRQVRSDDQTKRKMLEILKRFHAEEEEEEEEDDDSTLSEEMIEKVLSGGEISVDDLSPEERKGFQRAVASGELSKLIQPWEPWWLRPSARTIALSPQGTQLVQCITDESVEQENMIPRGPHTPLPPLSKLSMTTPSPLLALHLVDIIYSYCFTLRIYNGDWQSDPLGSASMVLTMSSVLSQSAQPKTVKEVISHSLEQTCSAAYKHMGGLKLGLTIMEDVATVLSLGWGALICLLCDVQRMMKEGVVVLVRSYGGSGVKKKLKMGEKKVYFMMCWVKEQGPEEWSVMANTVVTEKKLVEEIWECKGMKQNEERKKKKKKKGGVIIEEMEECH